MGKVINVQMDEDFYNEIIQGGSSGSGEASTIEYLDVSNWGNIVHAINGLKPSRTNIIQYSNLSRTELDGEKAIVCSAFAAYLNVGYEYIDRIAIDFNAELLYPFGKSTPKEELIAIGITQEQLDAIPRITKEDFYSLE